MYYLQSRYYDAKVGRFVNADEVNVPLTSENSVSKNLFSYVTNNPINKTDETGLFSLGEIIDVINRIIGYLGDACEILLKGFGISLRNYKKRNKYKKRNDLKNFVFKNKNKIKKMGNSISDIANFVEIVIIVVECQNLIQKHKNLYLQIAEVLFYGFVKIISIGAAKLISSLLSKITFFLRFIFEKILLWIFEKYFGYNSYFCGVVKKFYLQFIDTNSMNFFDYIIAIFKGTGKAIALA